MSSVDNPMKSIYSQACPQSVNANEMINVSNPMESISALACVQSV